MLLPESRPVIRLLYAVNRLFARVYHNLTVLGPEQLPRQGPAIVVCNHISSLDPLLMQSACNYRLITWMMAKEYLDIPLTGALFRTLEVIPVDRGSKETRPMRAALRQLAEGRVVGIFPEGRISTMGQLQDFQTGVALLAIRAKAPVYPAYLDGTQRNSTMTQAFFHRSNSVINFGPAVEFDRSGTDREHLENATVAIRSAVEHLRLGVDEFRKFR